MFTRQTPIALLITFVLFTFSDGIDTTRWLAPDAVLDIAGRCDVVDGWHRLEVRVRGRNLTVRARPGYLAENKLSGNQK